MEFEFLRGFHVAPIATYLSASGDAELGRCVCPEIRDTHVAVYFLIFIFYFLFSFRAHSRNNTSKVFGISMAIVSAMDFLF